MRGWQTLHRSARRTEGRLRQELADPRYDFAEDLRSYTTLRTRSGEAILRALRRRLLRQENAARNDMRSLVVRETASAAVSCYDLTGTSSTAPPSSTCPKRRGISAGAERRPLRGLGPGLDQGRGLLSARIGGSPRTSPMPSTAWGWRSISWANSRRRCRPTSTSPASLRTIRLRWKRSRRSPNASATSTWRSRPP